MTTMLVDYPKNAAFGRVLPKSKIFEHASPSTAVKELFVRQVKEIIWEYKLAPETINLTQTRSVPEIQVFSINLKEGELNHDVLKCIDKSIQFPLLFELHFEGKTKAIAAYKRPNEADSSKWVISDYFETPWLPSNTPRMSLPIVLNLEELYSYLLNPLMPFPPFSNEGMQARVERMELIRSKQRDIEKCKTSLQKEKQFNRKVTINAELRALNQKLENLTCPLASAIP